MKPTSIVDRLQKLTNELMELNAELEQDMATLAVERSSPVLNQYALLKAFKGVLDHSRHLLWPYLLAAEQKAEDNVLHAMQTYRMDRIRQMLEAMQRDRQASGQSQGVDLFLSELQRRVSGSRTGDARPN